jgi:hypothetical protein
VLFKPPRDILAQANIKFTVTILENVDAINCRHAGDWLRGLDLNQRPSGYEPDELPGCSTPRDNYGEMMRGSKLKAGLEADNPTGESQFRPLRIRVEGVTIFSINSTTLA